MDDDLLMSKQFIHKQEKEKEQTRAHEPASVRSFAPVRC